MCHSCQVKSRSRAERVSRRRDGAEGGRDRVERCRRGQVDFENAAVDLELAVDGGIAGRLAGRNRSAVVYQVEVHDVGVQGSASEVELTGVALREQWRGQLPPLRFSVPPAVGVPPMTTASLTSSQPFVMLS